MAGKKSDRKWSVSVRMNDGKKAVSINVYDTETLQKIEHAVWNTGQMPTLQEQLKVHVEKKTLG